MAKKAEKNTSLALSSGNRPGKFRVVLFLSYKGSGIETLLALSRQSTKGYEIAGALLTTPQSQAIPVLRRWRIPFRVNDIHGFYSLRGAKVSDLSRRKDYDRRSLELIAHFNPSHIALYGYIYILTHVMLGAFPGRILNLHDSDLTIRNEEGVPKYRGLHATRDSILAGEPHTYSSVHVVTDEVDAGPMIARSHPYPVDSGMSRGVLSLKGGNHDTLKSYAYAQREWMMRDCWPLLMNEALEYLVDRQACIESPWEPHYQALWRTGGGMNHD